MLFCQVIVMITAFGLMHAEEQREGDACVVKESGQPGDCIHISKCESVLNAAYEGVLPQLCISQGAFSVVCCPRLQGPNAPIQRAIRIQPKSSNPAPSGEGKGCKMKGTGIGGECRRFANCQIARDDASQGVLPQKCDLTNCDDDVICCAKPCMPLPGGTVTQQLTGSKAADYCVELAEKVFPCHETSFGWTRGDICPLNSDSSGTFHFTPLNTTSEVPHLGKLGTGNLGKIAWKAAATLVSDRWVITSAFFVGNNKNIRYVGLGGIFQLQYAPDAIYDVGRIVIHPEYNNSYSSVYNDIALVQLDRQVKFTSRILPACLHTGTLLPSTGLLTTGLDYDNSSIYAKTSLNRVPQDECSGIFRLGSRLHPDGVKPNIEICTRPVHAAADAVCKGIASGSPLYLDNGPKVACTQLFVGIEAARDVKTCSFVYLRVAGYLPWIESIVWP